MQTIQLDKLADVTGGSKRPPAKPAGKPSLFSGPRVVNGPVILDNKFELQIRKQGGNSVHELRIQR